MNNLKEKYLKFFKPEPLSADKLKLAEKTLGVRLPADFKK
ncbi:hypothetical protein PssB301D_04701 [Pseudomonas syringae pv. syringae str. B301D-R]|nr:hypothetical protein PsyrB_26130 [Pseudomonas syringae pv. syringae B301D]EXL29105.1 hypothetical protein PssB301D_04701 [Pseudomonas syringae pv. syringae str. B301D-R]